MTADPIVDEEVRRYNFDPRLAAKIAKMTPDQKRRLMQLVMPRVVDEYMKHTPHPKQQAYLSISGEEAMYGGAAGGGKSDALLMAALQYVDVPGYSALILRRTWPDLNAPGAILDRARTWLAGTDAHAGEGGRIWTFPSGARIQFGYLQFDKDKHKYQSAEYQFIGFDELTHFEEATYNYMFSRIRRPQLACVNCQEPVRKYFHASGAPYWKHTSKRGQKLCPQIYPDPKVLAQYPGAKTDGLTIFDVPLRMRSATNPGGIGHAWVRAHFIDERTRKKGATFVPASLLDNPSLDRESYQKNLMHLNSVDRERLLKGDWDVTEEGDYFQRHWFPLVDQAPRSRRAVRYWDLAATQNDGDFTVGTKMVLDEGIWYIADIVRGQWSPGTVEKMIHQTAMLDGRDVPIRMEQEPGASGKSLIDHYRRNILVGFDFRGERPSGDKVTRAKPMSSAAEAKNVRLVSAQWNRDFLDEAALFPNGNNDDQIDTCSGAMYYLSNKLGRVLV